MAPPCTCDWDALGRPSEYSDYLHDVCLLLCLREPAGRLASAAGAHGLTELKSYAHAYLMKYDEADKVQPTLDLRSSKSSTEANIIIETEVDPTGWAFYEEHLREASQVLYSSICGALGATVTNSVFNLQRLMRHRSGDIYSLRRVFGNSQVANMLSLKFRDRASSPLLVEIDRLLRELSTPSRSNVAGLGRMERQFLDAFALMSDWKSPEFLHDVINDIAFMLRTQALWLRLLDNFDIELSLRWWSEMEAVAGLSQADRKPAPRWLMPSKLCVQ